MLSYRHGFHAGNFADVLKHSVLSRVLVYLRQKDKPLLYLDTHAGRGVYSLTTREALKTGEFQQGIGRIWQRQAPEELEPYLDVIRVLNPDGTLQRYPGSPWLAHSLLRPTDRILLCELHPQDYQALSRVFRAEKRVYCVDEDGFARALAAVPPIERRGVVLIDPSYEIKTDYQRVIRELGLMYRRFATGVYLLWYPVISRSRIDQLRRQLVSSGIRRVCAFEINMVDDEQEGMTGTGMIVINPPWPLLEEMRRLLPFLTDALGASGQWSAEELVGD